MGKNIAIFCDGTSNSALDEEFGIPASTNVYRLYQACCDQATYSNKQFVWYQSGVGSLGGKYKRGFQGATGTGVSDNIKRAYQVLAKNYQEGDAIFLFGFSRGAFTARSLAGMVQQVGLLKNPTSEAVALAYKYYQTQRTMSKGIEQVKGAGLAMDVRIRFIGIWDTVGALGLSFWGVSFNFLNFFGNAFHVLSPNRITDQVCHALAMDEVRTAFMPTLWDFADAEDRRPEVEQAWFRGVHSDVGGGYSDRGLADISLTWMKNGAQNAGLLLRPNALTLLAPDPMARIHRSNVGRLWTSMAPWPRWYPPLVRDKTHPMAPTDGYLHNSVFEREELIRRHGRSEPPLRSIPIGSTDYAMVYADQEWNNTSLIFEQGGVYRIVAEGWWQDAYEQLVSAEGQLPKTESIFKRLARPYRRVPKRRWMALIGLVNYPRKWYWSERPIREALYYLIEADPEPVVKDYFHIGTGTEFTVNSETGVFWAFANDWWATYGNNTGTLKLSVTRLS